MPSATRYFLLAILVTLARKTESYITVKVEMNPTFATILPKCTRSFTSNFESVLTAFVVNATAKMSTLSDFTIPAGLHLTYFNYNGTRRRLRSLATAAKSTSCTSCSSAGCSVSCGLGVCKLCSSSRRAREISEVEDETQSTDQHRMLALDWSEVGIAVTTTIVPLISSYVRSNLIAAGGCLGDPQFLNVNVTFLSDVSFSDAMAAALVSAFSALFPAPLVAGPNACCTSDFYTCVGICGTTQQQCTNCLVPSVAWLPPGPPKANSCLPRYFWCSNNETACCPGLTCVGNDIWKGCMYIPPAAPPPSQSLSLPPTSPPVTAPKGCCSSDFKYCTPYCQSNQTACKQCFDSNVAWLPNGAPAIGNMCLSRWNICTYNVNGCCPGLSCVSLDAYTKQCAYVP